MTQDYTSAISNIFSRVKVYSARLYLYNNNTIQIKLGWALFVTYTIIQSIMRSEMCSLHLTHPSVHTWNSGQPTVQRPGSSHGLPFGAGIRTHNLGLNKSSLHLTHPKRIRTWSSGQPLYGAQGAVRGSVPCSRALQSQFLPARDSNLRTSGYRLQARLSNH